MLSFVLTFFVFIRSLFNMFKEPEFRSIFTLVIFTLALGTVTYHSIEGWTWIDSLYFSVITLTTIGYGDLAPVTDAGKIFTIIYVFIGIGILLGFVNASGEHFRKQHVERMSQGAPNFLWDSGNTLEEMEKDILENIKDE
ncbi:potassium channel family protein [Methanolobus vulcani]|uniref:Two pore domain potassium channel family protein n=1 Tax=Methanolobus vulcani TaxID=38026 RepID=A0A7Z8P2F7_9EURY|nr:potassium channel family protein [Methanolobus vulcani]TQD25379.1 two pore domain potassium channel family protein [Methanolobus vulcani]